MFLISPDFVVDEVKLSRQCATYSINHILQEY